MIKTIATTLAAAIAVVGLSSPVAAQPPVGRDCGEAFRFNGYIDDDIGESIARDPGALWSRNCKIGTDWGTIGVATTIANTKREVRYLRHDTITTLRGNRSPWLFCPVSEDSAYTVNWIWHTEDVEERPGELRAYTRWAMEYKREHGCLRSWIRDY